MVRQDPAEGRRRAARTAPRARNTSTRKAWGSSPRAECGMPTPPVSALPHAACQREASAALRHACRGKIGRSREASRWVQCCGRKRVSPEAEASWRVPAGPRRLPRVKRSLPASPACRQARGPGRFCGQQKKGPGRSVHPGPLCKPRRLCLRLRQQRNSGLRGYGVATPARSIAQPARSVPDAGT